MKELQGLLWEANQFLEHEEVKLEVPLIHVWALYEVSDTILGMPQSVWSIADITRDYSNWVGIGATVSPNISGLPKLCEEIREEASKIVAIHDSHHRVMDSLTWLCFNHIRHKFPWESYYSRGWLFRIQITASSAVFQILFLIWHGLYAISHEADLSTITDGSAFRKQPFSQIPPDLTIPSLSGSWGYMPATYQNWKSMLESIHYNAPRPKTPMYRSRTADVFEGFGKMVEELKAA